jgi:hypothetical protein
MKQIGGFIGIANKGQDIGDTNYWGTEQALAGLCYVSMNAGAIRLLVPKPIEGYVEEMKTGKRVSIEKGYQDPRCVDIVFEDGTHSPFFVAIARQQMDCILAPRKRVPFSVWTEAGKQLQLLADIKKL